MSSPEQERLAQLSFYRNPQIERGETEDGSHFLRRHYESLDVQPELDEFELYANEQQKDQETVRRLETLFKDRSDQEVDQEVDQKAMALERFLTVEIDRSDWFGATTFRTTQFDDQTGSDLVLEWDVQERFGFVPRLAIDVTGATQASGIERKFKKAINGVDIKYFASDVELDEEGEAKQMSLMKLPIVTLGVDLGFVEGIGQYAIRQARTKTVGVGTREATQKTELPPQAFADFPIQDLLLEQASAQVDAQIRIEADRLAELCLVANREDLYNAVMDYQTLLKQGHPDTNSMIIIFEKVEGGLKVLEKRLAPTLPKKLDHVNQAKDASHLPPIPAQTIQRWKNLLAVRTLLMEKRAEIKKTNNREADNWRKASVTHKLLTRLQA